MKKSKPKKIQKKNMKKQNRSILIKACSSRSAFVFYISKAIQMASTAQAFCYILYSSLPFATLFIKNQNKLNERERERLVVMQHIYISIKKDQEKFRKLNQQQVI